MINSSIGNGTRDKNLYQISLQQQPSAECGINRKLIVYRRKAASIRCLYGSRYERSAFYVKRLPCLCL